MHIRYLTLHQYKRLMLNNIQTLTLTPESVYQLILGTNGCGKSSLLYELTPLPAQSAQYCSGGYKEIHIEHLGVDYQLRSSFGKPHQHCFLKDGAECNPGHTLTVQRDLVKHHFGIDQTLHELLIGQLTFTALTPAKRREWMTRLCQIDFDYALDVYQRLKQKTRDEQGALKHVKQRIEQEITKIKDTVEQKALEREYQHLHDELMVLFRHQHPRGESATEALQTLKKLLQHAHQCAKELVESKPNPVSLGEYRSLNEVNSALHSLQAQQQSDQAVRARLCEEHDQLTTLINEFQKSGVHSIEAIKEKHQVLEKRIASLRSTLTHWTTLNDDPYTIQRVFYDTQDVLISRIKALAPNPNRYFTTEQHQHTQIELNETRREIEKKERTIAALMRERDTLDALKENECPNCNHRWTPGFDAQRHRVVSEHLKKEQESLNTLKEREQKAEHYLEQSQNYQEALRALRAIEQHYPPLSGLMQAIISDAQFFEDPPSVLYLIYQFSKALETHVLIANEQAALNQLDKLLQNPQALQQHQSLTDQQHRLKRDIDTYSDALEQRQRALDALKKHHTQLNHYYAQYTGFEQRLHEIHQQINACIDSERNAQLNTLIERHQCRLATLQQQRSEHEAVETIIKDLKHSEQTLSEDARLLETLTRLLSPTEGLIAEALGEFIGQFVDHVNAVISMVWTYKLSILPCSLDDGELDYRFPMHIEHEGLSYEVPDIAKGSEAQVDIINFAFRLVTMSYLGFESYPLYIDELGRSFDEQHRLNLLTFLKQFLDSQDQRQLFMVSHFASQFGIFTNADVLVLDKTNITTPTYYNTHARLE